MEAAGRRFGRPYEDYCTSSSTKSVNRERDRKLEQKNIQANKTINVTLQGSPARRSNVIYAPGSQKTVQNFLMGSAGGLLDLRAEHLMDCFSKPTTDAKKCILAALRELMNTLLG